MNKSNLWLRAKSVDIQVPDQIVPGFDIGFDDKIPHEIKNELRTFVTWVESNFNIPVTLWVDFEYKHYLVRRNGERVGYMFYWTDFSSYPVFDNIDDIPQIRLPVRTEHSTTEEILRSFIEAVTAYFAWICNEIHEGYEPNENDAEEILQEYLRIRA